MSAVPDLFQIARDLIAIDSTTGREEGVVAYLESRFREMNLDVRSVEVAPGRRNIQAGPERPRVLLSTHTDTVPPYVPLSEDEDFIYGRGACDTKGITACMIEAGRRLLAKGIDDFGYLFVVGEEVDNCGARRANEDVRCDYLVVGEPTENCLAVGHKGFLSADIIVEGTACHSAYPELGDSAVHRLLGILDRLMKCDFGSSDLLGPATLNIGRVEGGVAANVLAPGAKATFAIRVVTNMDEAEAKLQSCLVEPGTGQADPRVKLEFHSRMVSPPLERIEGFEETVVSYGTDVPFMLDIGKPLLYGPGSIEHAHTAGEKIAKESMLRAVEDYMRFVEVLEKS